MSEVATRPDVAIAEAVALPQAAPRKTWSVVPASLGLDALMLAATLFVAEAGAPHAGVPPTPAAWLAAFPVLVVLLLAARGMYRPRLFLRTLDDLRATVTTVSLAAMVILSARVLLTDQPWVAAQTARLWLFACVLLVAGRAVLAWSELQNRRAGATRPTLLVGAGQVGHLTARRLLAHPELGLRPVGFLDKEPIASDDPGDVPVLGASWDLERVVREHKVAHVIVTFSTAPHHVLFDLVRRCEALGVEVSIVPRFFERMSGAISVERLGGLPLVRARPSDPASWQFTVKYAFDRVLAALLLLVCAPLLIAAAVSVWLSAGRPILFTQARVGANGRVFSMLKFRTMRIADDADLGSFREHASDTAPGGVEGKDRRTRVGAFLRKTSIDELPQLFNVLKGEMSIVGPRPERPEYVALFEERVYRYGERHRVKAGITGWAQVNGLRGKTSLADRVEWDNFYIENWSLWLDVKILLLTFLAVISPRAVE
jgi:exopolysaccharide biosynthesis polyprenyl glycosylphosphotransferase